VTPQARRGVLVRMDMSSVAYTVGLARSARGLAASAERVNGQLGYEMRR